MFVQLDADEVRALLAMAQEEWPDTPAHFDALAAAERRLTAALEEEAIDWVGMIDAATARCERCGRTDSVRAQKGDALGSYVFLVAATGERHRHCRPRTEAR
jgi:hypothetical protein